MRPSPAEADGLAARGAGLDAAILALLVLAVALIYAPVRQYGFLTYDDPEYVTDNRHVAAGLTFAGVAWAFTTAHASNWHPLTWMSHMLDVELFGTGPMAPHLMNVALHAANGCLVFLLLRQLTGSRWRSALVAALFALHPLRVESVAWIAERKDVLSAFFFLLSVWAYARYAQKKGTTEVMTNVQGPMTNGPRSLLFRHWSLVLGHWSFLYRLSLLLFACALLSKPMAVTLPLALLLIDFWPLDRMRRQTWWQLVTEKIPFLALSAAACVATLIAQQRGGAVRSLDAFSLGMRIENAAVSYARYLGKIVWPADLAVFYPHPGGWDGGAVVAAAVLFATLSAIVWRLRQQPFLFAGWAWFCVLLLPVIGLIQVGGQSMADRYTYLASLGIVIAVVWSLAAISTRVPRYRSIAAIASGLIVVACAARTHAQLQHWRSSETLFRHAAAVTAGNYVAHNHLAGVFIARGDSDGAIQHAMQALAIRPNYADAYNNLGQALLQKGNVAGALEKLQVARDLAPDLAEIHNNLGNALLQQGRTDEAIASYRSALHIRDDDARVHNNLGWALFQAGQIDEAIASLRQAITRAPDYANAHHNLAGVLLQREAVAEAIAHLQRAAAIYAQSGDLAEAVAVTEKGLRLAESRADSRLGAALQSEFETYRARMTVREP